MPLFAQGTAFQYQGKLTDAGAPANAAYDLRFTLYNAVTNGQAVSGPQTNAAVAASNGLFAVTLDFGAGFFTGTNYWLDLAVRPAGSNTFTLLVPRQPLLPVPYAIFANSASNVLGKVAASQLTGPLPSAQLAGTYSGTVNFSNATNSFAGSFTGTFAGNGAALTNLNGTNLTSGTVADARLSTNVALLDHNQTFTGNHGFAGVNNFSNAANTFAGTFSGNGAALTTLNGSEVTFGTMADARLTANVALLDHDQTFSSSNNFTGDNTLTGVNTMTNWGNSFSGSFFGNGLVGWIVVSNTAVTAERDHGYLLLNSGFTTVTLPASSLVAGDIVRISGAGAGGWRVAQNTSQSIYGNFMMAINSDWQQGYVSNKGLNGIAASADGFKMVAVAGSGGIFTSVDYGQTWNNPNTINGMTCVASSANGIRLVAGNNASTPSSIILSTNAGNNWGASATPVANCQALAVSADGTRQVAVVYGGRIYTSTNSGTNWILNATDPNNRNWYSVAASSDGTRLAAVVNGGQVYTSANYGANWAVQANAPVTNWTGIASSADGSKLAACVYGGKIYTSSDYGVNWSLQANAPTTNWSSIVSSSDGSRLLAAVYGGGIYLSANMGFSWSKQPVPDPRNWTSVACSADCTKMAAVYFQTAASGGIYYGKAFLQSTTTTTTPGVLGSIGGSQGSAVELQYIGNNQFMPVSSAGLLWAN